MQRRNFVTGLGLIAGSALSRLSLAQETPISGTTPMTQEAMDNMFRKMAAGGPLTCVRTVEGPEGPYYYESSARRRAITEGHQGVPLRLGITVATLSLTSGCTPLSGAIVDLWQADAEGMYSNVGNDVQVKDTVGQTFLRGHQVTDQNGYVEFDTIVPGWELASMIEPIKVAPRTPHIHAKVFYERQLATTQLFLPDDLIDQLFAEVEPYRSNQLMTAPALDRSYERIHNADDLVFNTTQAQPMSFQREGRGIVAKASIGLVPMAGRGIKSYFR